MRLMACFLTSLFLIGASGCATSGDLDSLGDRVAALEAKSEADANRIGALESSFSDVSAAADKSAELATEAAARAQAAEGRADDAARKANAIFKKSVSK